MKIKNYFFIFFILFFSLSLNANELKKTSIQLNWNYQFEFAGYIAAIEKGFYKEIGYDVELRQLNENINVVDEVKNQRATFGIYDSSILDNYDNSKPIILLANYLKKSPLVFVTKQDIYSPTDLKNKKVMISNFELQNSSLSKLLEKFKIKKEDFITVPHEISIEKFIKGEVDVTTAYITNEIYYLQKQKIPFNILNPMNYEIYGFGGNLFSSLDYVKNNTSNINNFIKATNKGWKYALENKEEIIDIIYNKYSKQKSKEALRYEARMIENIMLLDVYKLGEIRKALVLDELIKAQNINLIDKSITLNDIIYSLSKYSKDYNFSFDELEYLNRKKQILMCTDPLWMPYEKIEEGKHIGIISDYISFFEKEINIPIKLYVTKSWEESLKALSEKKCDILSGVISTQTRSKIMDITKPYINFPLVIATKKEEMFISNLEEVIETKKVAVIRGYAYLEVLKKRYPKNKIVLVNNVEEGLEKVLHGEIFGFIDSITTIGYKLQREYFSELKIAGKFDEKYSLGIGVRNDEPLLFSIFDKLVLKLDISTKHEILKKWINVRYDGDFDYKLFWKIFIIFAIIIFIITYRYKEVVNNKEKLQKERKKLEEKNSELRKMQKALKESIQNFEVLLDSTMEAVLVFKEHVCIDINKVGYKLLGYKSKAEVIGKSLYHHVHDDFIVTLKESLNRNLESYEIEFVRTDGSTFPALVKDRYIYLNNERVKLFTIVDLTELKNKENLLFKQSKLAAMGEMIGNIAHQWRQPLSLISTIATGLKLKIETQTDDKNEAIEFLDRLNTTSQHLSATIDDFRNFFVADKRKEQFLVDCLIEQNLVLLDSIFKTNFIEVKVAIPKDITLNTYKNELTQALLNILNNANDAFKEKSLEEDKYIFIKAYKKQNNIIICIKDNAGGIPSNIIDKIFEPYFTTKHKSNGTGIGLYMTYQIINEHIHGKIEVENCTYIYNNETHKGAKFIITIPNK